MLPTMSPLVETTARTQELNETPYFVVDLASSVLGNCMTNSSDEYKRTVLTEKLGEHGLAGLSFSHFVEYNSFKYRNSVLTFL